MNHLYFGVYDGHCGHAVADALASSLYKKFVEAKVFETSEDIEYAEVLKKVFMDADKVICDKLKELNHNDGSTCVTVSFTNKGEMICAHVGDSRAVARVQGKPVELTKDHDPDPLANKDEKERVEKRGGKVTYHKGSWRINECLSVSRAFGDIGLKKDDPPVVDAEAEVSVQKINSEMDTVIVCSDGLHHLMENIEIVKTAHKKALAEEAGQALLTEIDSNTRSQLKGHDNTTIITLKIRHGSMPVECRCDKPI